MERMNIAAGHRWAGVGWVGHLLAGCRVDVRWVGHLLAGRSEGETLDWGGCKMAGAPLDWA